MLSKIFVRIMALIIPLVILLNGGAGDYSKELAAEDYTGLKDAYAGYFDIGTSVASWYTYSPEICSFLKKNFSSLTPEVELKLPYIHPDENTWNFESVDRLCEFCRENGMKLRGHTLVWDECWMLYDENGSFVGKEVFYARLYDYMKVIMERYGDVIKVWDVVNEPFNYNAAGPFKKGEIYTYCGEEFITKAFEFAREIAPDATLVLNETSLIKSSHKLNYMLKYIKKWREDGVPIDAVGIQGHWKTLSPKEVSKGLERVLTAFENIGIKNIQLTEIDMSLYTSSLKEKYDDIPQWLRDAQTVKYREMFKVLRRHKDTISSVTFWGIDDEHNMNRLSNENDEPMLFSGMRPKAGFFAVCDF